MPTFSNVALRINGVFLISILHSDSLFTYVENPHPNGIASNKNRSLWSSLWTKLFPLDIANVKSVQSNLSTITFYLFL